MGLIVPFLNFKGGVGKTTLSVYIAWFLQNIHKKRVLLLDLDPQFNLTQLLFDRDRLKRIDEHGPTSDRILRRASGQIAASTRARSSGAPDPIKVLLKSNDGPRGLSVVPGSFDLADFVLDPDDALKRGASTMCEDFLRLCREDYDITIVDLNPSPSLLTYWAIENADHLVCPTRDDRFSYRGLRLIVQFITQKVPEKAVNTFYSVVFNGIEPEKLGSRPNPMYQLEKDKWFSDAILRATIPQTELLHAVNNRVGVFLEDSRVPETHTEYAMTVEALTQASNEVVLRLKL